jgi:hypothetical protein
MHAFLAAFTSEAVVPGGTRWVAQSRTTCRDTCREREATIKTSDKNQNARGSLFETEWAIARARTSGLEVRILESWSRILDG